MRFNVKEQIPIKVGDVRMKTRFLFFPKTINNELRWFEVCSWEEEAIPRTSLAPESDIAINYIGWKANRWID
jgi:hypothetical protein